MARAYGVFNEALKCANRATILNDTDGKVVDHLESENLSTPPAAERYEEALAKL